jgi:predicted amidohydrolase
VLASVDSGPGIAIAEIDPTRIVELRASLPALEHRIVLQDKGLDRAAAAGTAASKSPARA